MANEIKGEVEFVAGPDRFILVFDVNALCEVESILGRPTSELTDKITTGDMRVLRAFMWGGLREKHPDISLVEAGDIIQEGGVGAASGIVLAALVAAFPAPAKVKANRPRRARSGPA